MAFGVGDGLLLYFPGFSLFGLFFGKRERRQIMHLHHELAQISTLAAFIPYLFQRFGNTKIDFDKYDYIKKNP